MTRDIVVEPRTARAFAEFGDIIAASGSPTKIINGGRCERFSNLARLDIDASGNAGVSLFRSEAVTLPLQLTMLERHPLGSQAFIPMSADPFLVIVAPDAGEAPGTPRAFLTEPGQGVNYKRGCWHGVLTPLDRATLFAVVDRIGPGANLEEHHLATPYLVTRG